jgi:hypothetical protein
MTNETVAKLSVQVKLERRENLTYAVVLNKFLKALPIQRHRSGDKISVADAKVAFALIAIARHEHAVVIGDLAYQHGEKTGRKKATEWERYRQNVIDTNKQRKTLSTNLYARGLGTKDIKGLLKKQLPLPKPPSLCLNGRDDIKFAGGAGNLRMRQQLAKDKIEEATVTTTYYEIMTLLKMNRRAGYTQIIDTAIERLTLPIGNMPPLIRRYDGLTTPLTAHGYQHEKTVAIT